METTTTAAQPFKAAFKAIIRYLFFHPGWYRSNYSALERMFRFFKDPWNFENSPYEKDRMDLLEQFVARYPHSSILEVGCAEGVFTERLQQYSNDITAVDVSATAIERARERCPDVNFVQAGIEHFEPGRSFDLVICSETLYYVRDVSTALAKISRLGRYCLVSYLNRESKTLDGFVKQLPLMEFKTFEKQYGMMRYSMNVAIWKTPVEYRVKEYAPYSTR